MVKVQLATLPDESVAMQVTVVRPTANVEPDAGEQATVGAEVSSKSEEVALE